ncbi:Ivy family c-type lysozyme inhibitor, partial [Enterococcus faecalis]
PHACAGQQVILLYNKADSTMRGVFVNDPAPTPNVGISDQAELTLLGHPDAAVKAWLKHELTTG